MTLQWLEKCIQVRRYRLTPTHFITTIVLSVQDTICSKNDQTFNILFLAWTRVRSNCTKGAWKIYLMFCMYVTTVEHQKSKLNTSD